MVLKWRELLSGGVLNRQDHYIYHWSSSWGGVILYQQVIYIATYCGHFENDIIILKISQFFYFSDGAMIWFNNRYKENEILVGSMHANLTSSSNKPRSVISMSVISMMGLPNKKKTPAKKDGLHNVGFHNCEQKWGEVLHSLQKKNVQKKKNMVFPASMRYCCCLMSLHWYRPSIRACGKVFGTSYMNLPLCAVMNSPRLNGSVIGGRKNISKIAND